MSTHTNNLYSMSFAFPALECDVILVEEFDAGFSFKLALELLALIILPV